MRGAARRPAGAEARSRGVRRRQRWTAAVVILCLIAGAWVGRRLGMADGLSGGVLGGAALGTLALLVARMARSCGLLWPEASAWALAVFTVAAAPFLSSVVPGPVLGRGDLKAEGDGFQLEPGPATSSKVSVTADLPEGSSVAFTLRSGAALSEGSLSRGTMRWASGGETRRYHEDRTSVLLDLDLPAGVRRLELERVSNLGFPLQVSVHAATLPRYLLVAAALGVVAALGWRAASLGGDRDIVMGAAMSVVAGLGAGATATPARAFAPALSGLLLGLVLGLPLGAAVTSAAGWLRRRR